SLIPGSLALLADADPSPLPHAERMIAQAATASRATPRPPARVRPARADALKSMPPLVDSSPPPLTVARSAQPKRRPTLPSRPGQPQLPDLRRRRPAPPSRA